MSDVAIQASDEQDAAVSLIEHMTNFASAFGIDELLNVLEGVQLAYEPFGSPDRDGAEIEFVTVQ
jgi:hypothetical protein